MNLFLFPRLARFCDISFKRHLNVDNARMKVDIIGQFVSMEKEGFAGLEKSLRIRVLVDVKNPFKIYIFLKLRNAKTSKVIIKYENLPNICFSCGRLGRGSNDCADAQGDRKSVSFGTWFKASPW